jgi:mono/diheme cytochrome c family protein
VVGFQLKMRIRAWILGGVAVALVQAAAYRAESAIELDRARAVVEESCQLCHNDASRAGNMSLDGFDLAAPEADAALAEKMIRKLRAGMMPPPGVPRPEETELDGLATLLETRLDEIATTHPSPGRRTFQRLNRAEYQASIRDLLDLDIDAGDYLPLDTKSANFDNIADVQMPSATLLEGYLRAASDVSRLAVGDAGASAKETTYKVTRWLSQTEQVDGAPYGTRGGISVVHNFPADGEYRFRVSFHHETTGALYGSAQATLYTSEANEEQIEISVNGERVALMDIDRWMHVSDPNGVNLRTEPIFIHSGPQRLSAAFIRKFEGPVQDLVAPLDWSIASTSIADAYGLTALPHLRDLAVTGPYDPTGISETPSREKIFTCRPASPSEVEPCAESIVSRLGAQAYRRPLTPSNLEALMSLYREGARTEGFESGIRTALEGILASPYFVFRLEEPARGAVAGDAYRLRDLDLAARLSFFLWGRGPDEELETLARAGRLSDPRVLEDQTRRMLRDPRSEALATRFAAQWLRLQDLEKMHPDVRSYPDFYEQLKQSMERETLLFFDSVVREDRNVLDLLTADYTFVDERLAKHYRIPGVYGEEFRRVSYPDRERRGLLGQGSILTLTSQANRTSPVLRGKWVMEVFLGSPPPPPPPNVPLLEATGGAEGGRMLSVREQMEKHRANPACQSCHTIIDPLGLALENFDATGAFRIKDNGVPIDASGQLYDGTPLTGPDDLRKALVGHRTSFIRTFTENLMAYALGRRVEYYDMPSIRAIEREAAANDDRMSSFLLGVVKSPAFQMKTAAATEPTEQAEPAQPDPPAALDETSRDGKR